MSTIRGIVAGLANALRLGAGVKVANGTVVPKNATGWIKLTPDMIVATHDPRGMLQGAPTADAAGKWSVPVSQASLVDQHEGQGCVVFTFAMPEAGVDPLYDGFHSRLCMQRPATGAFGVGLSLGDYAASKVYSQQVQYIPSFPKWRRAMVTWANLAPDTRELPDSTCCTVEGFIAYSRGSALAVYIFGLARTAIVGIVQGGKYETNTSMATPELQVTISASESGAQAATVEFVAEYFRPTEA